MKPDPAARHACWRARFKDPDTGRLIKVRLDPLAVSTAEARRDWAIRKSKALAKRRMDLESGAPRATGTTLSNPVDGYFKAHPRLRPRTVEGYRAAADKLVAWGEKAGVLSADELTRARLMGFREALIREPKRRSKKGGKRGRKEATRELRSPERVNSELRKVGTVLGYLRRLDLLPRISHDDLRDGLKRLPVTSERLAHLKPSELQKLLEAALRHDAETFEETREEHAGRRPVGTTPRYDPIAPFTAGCLLGGFRLGEVLELDWRRVDLDALDHEGTQVGEIHVAGAGTKTHKARTVGLEVSPALRKLLVSMHLARGGKGSVFGLTEGEAQAAAKRLRDEYGAPASFTWPALRRTCGTFLTNAPGIFGAASAYRSAKQLGHSVQVAERHYLGLVRGIPRDARTLETAMQVEDLMAKVIDQVSQRGVARLSNDVDRRMNVPILEGKGRRASCCESSGTTDARRFDRRARTSSSGAASASRSWRITRARTFRKARLGTSRGSWRRASGRTG